jgi:hypothetical protein
MDKEQIEQAETTSTEKLELVENPNEKIFTLSDNRMCKVIALKGKAMRIASRQSEGDGGTASFAMAAQGTFIEGVGVTVEDLDELPLKDTSKIMEAFGELNF